MVKVEEALNIIIKEAHELETEKVDILDSLNKILGENIYSKDNLPPFDKSAMDGYAIKSADTQHINGEAKVILNIVGTIKAGDSSDYQLNSGEAFKIMTGAPLPSGADCVIEIEKVKIENSNLYINNFVKVGNNVIEHGEEIKSGDLILEKGSLIRAVEIGVLASLGVKSVSVYKTPKVSLIITGDELVSIEETLVKGKIRNSNEYSLIALIKDIGIDVKTSGVVPDIKESIKAKIQASLENSDVIISSGGASVGEYDYIKDILKEIGADIKFDSIAIKPGKPVIFVTSNKKLFFGLPGNPLAIITTFEEFVKPALEKMMGKKNYDKKEFPVVLEDDFKGKIGRKKYIYVNLKVEDGVFRAYKTGNQSSSHLITLSKSNGLIIIPENQGDAKKGEVLYGRYIFK